MSKLHITPIGTCRIHSPLKRAATRYPIELDLRRNYGYVHTSAEALQQLRFLSGDKSFDPLVMPLIFRDPAEAPALEQQSWEPSELQIVEISSAKSIRFGDDFLQVNYLYRQFADFFASGERSRIFWNFVKKAHRGEMLNYLREEPSFRRLPREQRDLLLGLTIEQQSFRSVLGDMEQLVERIGRDKLLFVTHVNALTPDESVIPSRDRLIRWVKLAAEQLKVAVFDPTAAMQDFGQERALEKGGFDVTHYTPAFFDRVYDELHRSHVSERIQAGADGDDGGSEGQRLALVAANFEMMLEVGDFLSTSREVHAAIERAPDAAPLRAVRATIRSSIGDYEGALADFRAAGSVEAMSQPMRIAFLEASTRAGDPATALEIADGLLADEFESAQIYQAATQAAEKLGLHAAAVAYAKQAFRRDRSDLTAALHAMHLISREGDDEAIVEWRQEILESRADTASGAFEICVWAISHRDEDLFVSGLRSVAENDKGGTVDLLEDALEADMAGAVARSLDPLVAIGRLPRSVAERRTAILEALVQRAEALVDENRVDAAFNIAEALLNLQDTQTSQVHGRRLAGRARSLIRVMLRDVRVSIREAYARKDFEAIALINQTAGAVVLEDPDSAVMVARSLHALGREAEAVELIKLAQKRAPDNFLVLRWAARLTSMDNDLTTAIPLYGLLRSAFPDKARTIASELDRFFAVAERRAPKQLREMTDAGRFEEATQLADAMSTELGHSERVERELGRMFRALRIRLREIDEGDVEIEERELVLRHLVHLKSTDEGLLRRLALELMRQFRFLEAAEIWERIMRLNPQNESAERNLERCLRLGQRKLATVLDQDVAG